MEKRNRSIFIKVSYFISFANFLSISIRLFFHSYNLHCFPNSKPTISVMGAANKKQGRTLLLLNSNLPPGEIHLYQRSLVIDVEVPQICKRFNWRPWPTNSYINRKRGKILKRISNVIQNHRCSSYGKANEDTPSQQKLKTFDRTVP